MLTPNFNFFCKSANLCYNYLVNFNKGIGICLQIYEKKRKIYLSQNRTSPHRDLLSHCARAGSGRGCRFGVRSLPLPAEQSGKRQPCGTHRHCKPLYIALFLAALAGIGYLVSWLVRWQPLSSSSGIPQITGEIRGHLDAPWWQVLLAKIAGGTLSILSGLSLGREGPSIQLGGMAANCQGYQGGQNHAAAHDQLRRRCRTGSGI